MSRKLANDMEIFRWGIVGPGNIAGDFLSDLQHVPGRKHEVIGVLSDKAESAKSFANLHQLEHYGTDLGSFLALKPDAVYVATPHPFHHRYTIACLEAGIPVLCEKPLAMNAKEAGEMIRASANHQCFLMEGMWIRFLPSIRLLITLLEQDIIGALISVRADMSFKAPHDTANRYFNPDLGGGSLLDLGIYPVFLALLVLGKPDTIKAIARISPQKIDEACSILFHYPAGQYAILQSSIVEQTGLEAQIFGEKGSIIILKPWNEKPGGLNVLLDDGTSMHYPFNWEGRGFQFEVIEMMKNLAQHSVSSTQMSHQFSLHMMEVIDEIRLQTGIVYSHEKISDSNSR